MTDEQPLKRNLYGFIEAHLDAYIGASYSTGLPKQLARQFVSGALNELWDEAHDKVQWNRKEYFAIAALVFAMDVSSGWTFSAQRIVQNIVEIAAATYIATKIGMTSYRADRQYIDGDVFRPDPHAPEDPAIYRAASDRLKQLIEKRMLPRRHYTV